MMKLLTNKKFITIIGTIIMFTIFLLLTGCNRQIIDTHHNYKKIRCNYNDDKFELEIKTWKDYEGEQLQIKSYDGNTYLLSANNCYMIGD